MFSNATSKKYNQYLLVSKLVSAYGLLPRVATLEVTMKLLNKSDAKHALLLFFFLTGRRPIAVMQHSHRKQVAPPLYGFMASINRRYVPIFIKKYLILFLLRQDEIAGTQQMGTKTMGAIQAKGNTFLELDSITLDAGHDKNIFMNSVMITNSIRIDSSTAHNQARLIMQQIKLPVLSKGRII